MKSDFSVICALQSSTEENGLGAVGRSLVRLQGSDGTYIASVPTLQGCHTQGNSLDQVIERIHEAITLCIEEQGGMLREHRNCMRRIAD
jgi:predicted RNase H-like HicB family nuclease